MEEEIEKASKERVDYLKSLYNQLTFEYVIYFKNQFGSIDRYDFFDVEFVIKTLEDILNKNQDPINIRESVLRLWEMLDEDGRKDFEGIFGSINGIYDDVRLRKAVKWIDTTLYKKGEIGTIRDKKIDALLDWADETADKIVEEEEHNPALFEKDESL